MINILSVRTHPHTSAVNQTRCRPLLRSTYGVRRLAGSAWSGLRRSLTSTSIWGCGDGDWEYLRCRRNANPDSKSVVRIDAGNPANSQVTQQVDQVAIRYIGRVIGRDGRPIAGKIADNAVQAHIPLGEWLKWSTWFKP